MDPISLYFFATRCLAPLACAASTSSGERTEGRVVIRRQVPLPIIPADNRRQVA